MIWLEVCLSPASDRADSGAAPVDLARGWLAVSSAAALSTETSVLTKSARADALNKPSDRAARQME